jgi:hypothetical protein
LRRPLSISLFCCMVAIAPFIGASQAQAGAVDQLLRASTPDPTPAATALPTTTTINSLETSQPTAVPANGMTLKPGDDLTGQFLKRAAQGDAFAQAAVGARYFTGQGLEQNVVEAIRYFKLAADQGQPIAQFFLGVIYEHGIGVPISLSEAKSWYAKAAAQGQAEAQNRLTAIEPALMKETAENSLALAVESIPLNVRPAFLELAQQGIQFNAYVNEMKACARERRDLTYGRSPLGGSFRANAERQIYAMSLSAHPHLEDVDYIIPQEGTVDFDLMSKINLMYIAFFNDANLSSGAWRANLLLGRKYLNEAINDVRMAPQSRFALYVINANRALLSISLD